MSNDFSEMKRLGLWKTHALVYGFALFTSLLTTYFLTSSSLPRLKNDPIFVARAAGAEAGISVAEEADTLWEEDVLFHGEALFVVAAGDAENVPFPFVAAGVAGNFERDLFAGEDLAVKVGKMALGRNG